MRKTADSPSAQSDPSRRAHWLRRLRRRGGSKRHELLECIDGPMHGRAVLVRDLSTAGLVRVRGELYRRDWYMGEGWVLRWVARDPAAEQRERERLERAEHRARHDSWRRGAASAGLGMAGFAGAGGLTSVVMQPQVMTVVPTTHTLHDPLPTLLVGLDQAAQHVFEPAGEGMAALTGDRAEYMRQLEEAGRMMAPHEVAVAPNVPGDRDAPRSGP